MPVLAATLAVISGAAGCATEFPRGALAQPSGRIAFVTVDVGVQLEVIDWGGNGRAIVLLAGSGNTAHVFDDFAPKLVDRWHVYAITRRGYGASSRPAFGYDDQRLADDVLQVLDLLQIHAPVLVGHSMAGGEMTTLGNQHPARLGGLVYLDAIADPGEATGNDAAVMAAYERQPFAARSQPPPSRISFSAYRLSQRDQSGAAFPDSELRELFVENADGTVGRYKASTSAIHAAIGAGQRKRDYSQIRVPVLALSTFRCTPSTGGNDRCIEHAGDRPKYQPKDAAEEAAIQAFEDLEAAYISRWKSNIRKTARALVRLVDIPRANHHIFLSHEADVLEELAKFMATL